MKARDTEEEIPGGPLFFCLSLHVCPAAAGLRDEGGRGLLSLNTVWLLINEVTGEDPLHSHRSQDSVCFDCIFIAGCAQPARRQWAALFSSDL